MGREVLLGYGFAQQQIGLDRQIAAEPDFPEMMVKLFLDGDHPEPDLAEALPPKPLVNVDKLVKISPADIARVMRSSEKSRPANCEQ